jgi:hypothetical protein
MPVAPAPTKQPTVAVAGGKINREEIAAIVDKFLAGRGPSTETPRPPVPKGIEVEAGSMYTGPAASTSSNAPLPTAPTPTAAASQAASNGRQAVDFVSEDDVRRALQKGEKIYINAKTIITPAARDIGEPKEVFAKA